MKALRRGELTHPHGAKSLVEGAQGGLYRTGKVVLVFLGLALGPLADGIQRLGQRAGTGSELKQLAGGLTLPAQLVEVVGVDGLSIQLDHLVAVVGGHADPLLDARERIAGAELEDENDHRQDGDDGQIDLLVLAKVFEGMKGHWQSSLY